MQNIMKGELHHKNEAVWKSLSKEARDFIQALLQVNPKNRLSASEALQHPWLELHSKGGLKAKDLSGALASLKKFSGFTKIKQGMLGFFVQNMLSQRELNELAQQFKDLDKDGSGALSPQEVRQALKEI